MSDLFHLLAGMTQGTVDYVQNERNIQRKKEDDELDFTRKTLESMAQRPDFDSSQYASLINYMHSLSQPRLQKKGMKGFLGQHEELPVSQMIGSLTTGDPSQPFKGDPTQTTISDDKLGMLQGKASPQSGAQDPTKTAPSSSQAPSPDGGGAPSSQAPSPSTPSAAAGVPAPPLPPPPGAAGAAPAALQPQPPASLPQQPGTANMAQGANDLAIDSQLQAQRPSLPPPPPQMPAGLSDQDLAAARAGRGPGVGQLLKTPEEQRIAAGRADFSNTLSTSAGKIAGARMELKAMLGREPTLPELRQYMTGRIDTTHVVWQAHPSDPTKEIAMLEHASGGPLEPAMGADGQQLTRLKPQGVQRGLEVGDQTTASNPNADPTDPATSVATQHANAAKAKLDQLLANIQDKKLAARIKDMTVRGIPLPRDVVNAVSQMARASGQPYTADYLIQAAEEVRRVYASQQRGAGGAGAGAGAGTGSAGGLTPPPAGGTPPSPATPRVPSATGAGSPGAAGGGATPPTQPVVFGKLNAQQQQVTDTIKQAAPMIDRVEALLASMPKGDDGQMDNSVGSVVHAAGQRLQYSLHIKPSDPVYAELVPLASFLRIFNSQAFIRGIRNMQYVRQIQDHLPSPIDSPALLQDKLTIIKQNFRDILKDMYTTGPAGRNLPAPPAAP